MTKQEREDLMNSEPAEYTPDADARLQEFFEGQYNTKSEKESK